MNYLKQLKGVCLTIIILVVAAIFTSIQVSSIQSSMRAIIDEEGSWSKAHRDAFIAFNNYLHTQNKEHLNKFNQHLSFNRGVTEAKRLLDNQEYSKAKEILIQIGSHPKNIDNIIYLVKNYAWLDKSKTAFSIWDEANILVTDFGKMVSAYGDEKSQKVRSQLLVDIQATRNSMLKAEHDFENIIVDLSEQTDNVLSYITMLIFLSLGIFMFFMIRRVLNKVTEKDELYQATFNKSQLAYIQFKLNGDLIDANQQFFDLVNCKANSLNELNFFTLLKDQGNPAHLISVQNSNKHQEFQFQLNYENNQHKFFKAHTTLIHNYEGTPLYFVAAINDVSKDKAKNNALKELAHNDFLTGLMNKFAFQKMLSVAIKEKAYGYLLYMDLNGFKAVNDHAGHMVGDKILEQVTQTIHDQIRETDPLARMGGDEFALFLENVTLRQATEIAKKIRLALSKEPFTFELNTFNISISIGISGLTNQPKSISDLINQADQACYLSKSLNQVIIHQSLAKSA